MASAMFKDENKKKQNKTKKKTEKTEIYKKEKQQINSE